MRKKILYCDMDGVVADWCKKMEKIAPGVLATHNQELIDKYEATPGFYADLEPIPGSIEAIEILSKHYDFYFLSTASWENPSSWTDKRLWVEKYYPVIGYKRLNLSHNKGLLKGDFLIDDRIKNGVDGFTGEHIHFGTEKFPDWKTVLDYLLFDVIQSK